MIKLLYFGDFHNDEKVPSSRIDNFVETRKKKIKEILQIAKEENVVALLEPGDFLNKPKISNSYLSELKKDWGFTEGNIEHILSDVLLKNKTTKELIKAIEDCNRIPIIGTIGNHELIGASLKTYSDSAISQLVESGFIRLASKENPIILKDDDGTSVAITASPFDLDIDGDDKSAYIVDEKLGDFHIHMVHGMLMAKSFGNKFEHTTVQEIIYKTKADLTINGHDHIGYDPIYLDGKIAYNPGAPVRLSAEKKEMERKPKVTIIEIDKSGINLRDVYLQSAEDGNKVLSREHIDTKKIKNKKVAQMQSIINKAKIESSIDITDILKNIAKNKSLPEDVVKDSVDMILKEIGKTEPFNPKGEYYITSLELINFECHLHSYFEFSEGLNILAGESTNGKSSIIRALAELFLCNAKNPKKSIRFGETFFKVIITTSHGYQITRLVEDKPKGKNKNGWEIYDPNTGDIEYVNTKGLGKVQEILGLNYINLTEKNKVGINFSLQGKSWFFIGDNMTSPDKAKLLGVPFGAQYADAVLKDVNTKSKKVVSEINFIDGNINELDDELKKFNYLNELEDVFKNAVKLKNEINSIKEEINKLETLLIKKKEVKNKISVAEKVISIINEKELVLEPKLKSIKNEYEKIEKIEALTNRKKAVLKAGKEMSSLVKSLSNINQFKIELDDLKEDYNVLVKENGNVTKAKRLEDKKKITTQKITLAEKVVSKLSFIDKYDISDIKKEYEEIQEKSINIKKVKTLNEKTILITQKITLAEKVIDSLNFDEKNKMLIQLKNELENVENIETLLKSKTEISKKINKEEEIINKVDSDKEVLLSQMKTALKEMGTCPICHSNVDDKHIDEIISSYK